MGQAPERTPLVLAITRLGFAAVGIVAMTYQLATLNARPGFSPGNFFSFFTIQSNILAVAMLAIAALVPRAARTRLFDGARGGVTLYMTITGVVFALLLSGLQEELQTTIPWVDFVLHKLMPVVLLADWLLDPPRHRLRLRVAAVWLVFPIAWFAYTLVRGADVDWYPYPFVDVGSHGYSRVLVNAVVMLGGMAVAAVGFAWFGNRRVHDEGHQPVAGVRRDSEPTA